MKKKYTLCNDVSCKDVWLEDHEVKEFIRNLDKEIEMWESDL